MKVVHVRYTDNGNLLPKGGLTVAIQNQGNVVKIGAALCISEDPFERKKGFELATNANSGYRSVELTAKEIDVAVTDIAAQRLGDNAVMFLPSLSTWGLEKKAAYIMSNSVFNMDTFPFSIDLDEETGETVDFSLNEVLKIFFDEMRELKKAVHDIDQQLNLNS